MLVTLELLLTMWVWKTNFKKKGKTHFSPLLSSAQSQLGHSGLWTDWVSAEMCVDAHVPTQHTHTLMIERENITDHNGNHMAWRVGGQMMKCEFSCSRQEGLKAHIRGGEQEEKWGEKRVRLCTSLGPSVTLLHSALILAASCSASADARYSSSGEPICYCGRRESVKHLLLPTRKLAVGFLTHLRHEEAYYTLLPKVWGQMICVFASFKPVDRSRTLCCWLSW